MQATALDAMENVSSVLRCPPSCKFSWCQAETELLNLLLQRAIIPFKITTTTTTATTTTKRFKLLFLDIFNSLDQTFAETTRNNFITTGSIPISLLVGYQIKCQSKTMGPTGNKPLCQCFDYNC